ncbi:MAG: hypothetical protein H0X31_14275 [Nostocaceae cyanobacterium]|nr:hypothetical protein [Nostocaceae cyanobacterium]
MNEILNPPIEQLVKEIVAVNHAWKEAKDLFEPESGLAKSLRNLKTRLQVRLLRKYAPQQVYLLKDPTADASEPLYGLSLVQPIAGHTDAAHLPIRVAQEHLSEAEIERFCFYS